MKNSAHETNAKSVISFLIVLLAFGILLVFVTNKDMLLLPDSFPTFVTLSVVGLGLLSGLLFLIGKEHKPTHKTSSKKTSSKKKKK